MFNGVWCDECLGSRTDELLDGESVQDVEAGVEFERLVAALTHEAHLHGGAGRLGGLHAAETKRFITLTQALLQILHCYTCVINSPFSSNTVINILGLCLYVLR